jgi:CheY-like chemotaxis protein/HPt (histidine-containing phosphotransfer) domain-containing protein
MDGYAATAAIRREESERGKRPTPIIALTANVMARDRERCLAAGMNSFLAKPFTSEQLAAALRPVAEERGTLVFDTPESMAEPRSAVATAATPSRRPASADEQSLTETQVADMLDVPLFEPEPAPRADLPVTVRVKARPVLDVDQVNAIRALGRPQVLERLCTMLFEAAPATLQRIDSALASGDLETVAAAAHSIKSAIGNLGGRELAEQLDRCETEAREHGDLAAARSAAAGLREGYAAVEAALRMELQRATGT